MLGKRIRDVKTEVNIYEDLVNIHKSLPIGEELLYPTIFYLNPTFPFNQDLFRLCAFDYNFYISKRLKEKIEANKITGVDIRPINGFIKTPALA